MGHTRKRSSHAGMDVAGFLGGLALAGIEETHHAHLCKHAGIVLCTASAAGATRPIRAWLVTRMDRRVRTAANGLTRSAQENHAPCTLAAPTAAFRAQWIHSAGSAPRAMNAWLAQKVVRCTGTAHLGSGTQTRRNATSTSILRTPPCRLPGRLEEATPPLTTKHSKALKKK